ncbi:30S ribosomal protein S15, partial [Tetrabaena socialis]
VFGRATVARPVRVAAPSRARLAVNSYKNLENIDLTRVPALQRHESDTGSTEVQVARLSARIGQLSTHLAQNKKDYSARRGLIAILQQRKSLLQYMYKHDRPLYDKMISDFTIRSVVVGDTRGAARKREEAN